MNDTKIKNKIDLLEYIKYDEIKEEALSFINKIGGEKWNNLSEHDPGITILENLLFAIMDIDYRSKFLMIDLLADDPSCTTCLLLITPLDSSNTVKGPGKNCSNIKDARAGSFVIST